MGGQVTALLDTAWAAVILTAIRLAAIALGARGEHLQWGENVIWGHEGATCWEHEVIQLRLDA